MSENLGEALPLAELARVGLFSPFHFHRVFRAVTSETPGRFLAALRMAQARRLLLHSGLTVGAISSRVGYHSVGTFTTQFTRLVGVSPERFRRMVRELSGHVVPPSAPVFQAHPRTAFSLSGAVPPGDAGGIMLAGVVAEAVAGDAMDWTISPEPGLMVAAPRPPGRYRLQLLLLRPGWPAAGALVDHDPRSFLVGRTSFMIPQRLRRPMCVTVSLRAPEPTDPPLLSVAPVRLLAELLSAPVAISA